VSWEATAWARRLRGLGPNGKLVLLLMSDHVNEHDVNVCWPSLPRLAADSDLSRATVWRTIDRLEKLGLIERLGVRDAGSSMRYRLCMEVTTPSQNETTPSRQVTPGTPSQNETTPSRQVTPGTPSQNETTPVAPGDTTPSRQVTPESPEISSEPPGAQVDWESAYAARILERLESA
jgi:hypothetical protein